MDRAVTYDIELFPNVFTLSACEHRRPETMFTFELSFRRWDIDALMRWFNYLQSVQMPMIGFNILQYDYPIIHDIFMRPGEVTNERLYAKSMSIIKSGDHFGHMIWQSDRFAPQVDLFKIHHFDNVAKSIGLKALEFNMRSPTVKDMPVPVGTHLTGEQIDGLLIPYGCHDVGETDRFAIISAPNIEFRETAKEFITGDVMNFNDTKIGKEMLAQRLGDDLCYTFETSPSGWKRNKQPRQTPRAFIRLADIIFPYITFNQPEFRRILDWMKQQTITETKGVFQDVVATINGFDFHFGTGGIHGSVSARKFVASDEWPIGDIDVKSLYPSVAIANRLHPEHLGEKFVTEYANLLVERKKHKKGTVLNGMFKLAANGTYGDSGQPYSVFYDPQYMMTITINCQLLLCMLAEWLLQIPTFEIIQINTDGITYRVHSTMEWKVSETCKQWEAFTMLELESTHYARMFIRDVNNYVAQPVNPAEPNKLKGAYVWYKDALAISNASPSAWYKDLSSPVIQRAAEAAMLYGVDPADYMAVHNDPFDFVICAKVKRNSNLFIGAREVQRTTRYYIALNGAPMRKVSPPTGEPGEFKRKSGLAESDYIAISRDIGPGVWDARIHTANKSKYEDREIGINAGWLVAECNDMADFDWTNLNRAWYVEQAKKLIIT